MSVFIKLIEGGPALIEGHEESPLVQVEKETGDIETTNRAVAICRCGKSKKFPFCDGSHNKQD